MSTNDLAEAGSLDDQNTTPLRAAVFEMVKDALLSQQLGEAHIFEEPDWDTTEKIATANALRLLRNAASVLIKQIDQSIADDIGIGGAAKYGPLVYTYYQGSDEKCIDPEGFFGYLADNPEVVPKVMNPNYALKSRMPEAVRQTFFEKVPKPPALNARSVDDPDLPKWLAALPDGYIKVGKRPQDNPEPFGLDKGGSK